MVHMGILRGTMENMRKNHRKTIEKHRVSLKYGLILGYHDGQTNPPGGFMAEVA